MTATKPSDVKRVAVIGAGTIGASWAAWFLARGYDVTAQDLRSDGESFVRRFVDDAWPTLTKLGLAPGASPARIKFVGDAARAVDGAEFVQENVLEHLDLKQDVLAKIDAALPGDVVISSSTSSFKPSELSAKAKGKNRIVVGHPFNPPHLIPLVEVVGGPTASPASVDWAVEFYRTIGKHPIRVNKEIKGHVSNRLQMAMWREACYLIDQGVASVADVDAAIAYGPGVRWAVMGPTRVFSLGRVGGGLRHYLQQFTSFVRESWSSLGNPKLTPELIDKLVEGVEEGYKGRTPKEISDERDRCIVGILHVLQRERAKSS
jgi:3-hydroxyacyl-CoA dehydrogenase